MVARMSIALVTEINMDSIQNRVDNTFDALVREGLLELHGDDKFVRLTLDGKLAVVKFLALDFEYALPPEAVAFFVENEGMTAEEIELGFKKDIIDSCEGPIPYLVDRFNKMVHSS